MYKFLRVRVCILDVCDTDISEKQCSFREAVEKLESSVYPAVFVRSVSYEKKVTVSFCRIRRSFDLQNM
jgi:hypothetical protein